MNSLFSRDLNIIEEKRNRELRNTFDFLLQKLESHKGKMNVNIFFEVLESELHKNNLSSIISVSTESKGNITIKSSKFIKKFEILYELTKIKRFSLEDLNYEDVFKNKQTKFINNRGLQILNSLNYHIKIPEKLPILNAIVAPLIIEDEVIGFLEILSPKLSELSVDVFNDFSEKLIRLLANIILYNEVIESEKKQKDLFENTKEGLVTVNGRKMIFSEVNRAMTKITGYTRDELRQMNFIKLFDPREHERIKKYVRTRLDSGFNYSDAPLNYVSRILTKAGKKRYVEITITRFLNENEWFSVFEDITEKIEKEKALKASKDKYKSLWDNAPVGYHVLNKEGVIIRINDTELKMFGYKKDEMLNKSIFDFILPEQVNEAKKRFKKKIMGEKVDKKTDRIYVKKNGEKIHVSIEDVLEKDSMENIIGIRTAMTDITEITEIKNREDAQNELLKILNNSKTENEYLKMVTEKIFLWTGFSVGGIRILNSENEIPFEFHSGYSNDFIKSENFLNINNDKCACTKVIIGKSKHENKKYLNSFGSFCNNNLLKFLSEAKKRKVYDFKNICSYCGFSSILIVPIYFQKKIIGAIHLTKKEKNSISRNTVKFIESLSSHIGEGLNKISIKEALTENLISQNIINSLLRRSLQEQSLDSLLKQTFADIYTAPWLSSKSKGCLFLKDENSEDLIMKTSLGLSRSIQKKCSKVKISQCVCGKVAKSKKAVFTNYDDAHTCNKDNKDYHGHYCIPIVFNETLLGVLNIYLKKFHQYNKKELDFLTTVADVLAGIIQNKKLKKNLEESENKYRKLIDNANDAIMIIDKNANIIFANKYFETLTGYGGEDLKNFNFLKIVHKDDKYLAKNYFSYNFSSGKNSENFHFRLKNKSGEIKNVSNKSTFIEENGEIVGLQSIMRDITENIKLSEKIQRAKEHYEQVIDTIQDSICVVDKNLAIISCNKTFAEKTNSIINKTKGKNFKKIISRYEKGIFKNTCNKNKCFEILKIFQDGKPRKFIEKNIDKNGETKYHKLYIFPGKNNMGIVYQSVIVIKDITRRKTSEEEIRRLNEFNKKILDNVPVSIMTIDRTGHITSTNKYIKVFSGRDDFIGKKIYNIPFIKREGLVSDYNKVLIEGKPFFKDNCSYQTNEDKNKTKYLNIIAVPIFNENGVVEEAISMAIDNTEAMITKEKIESLNKDLENKVIQRTRQLDSLNKELSKVLELKSKFITDASHEIRTPLTIIQGNLDLAINKKGKNDRDVNEIYKTINGEVERISGILSDLTVLTNADSNSENFSYEPIDLNILTRTVIRSLEVLSNKKNIEIKHKKGPRDLIIMGDESKIEKLMLNILRNAIKYTEVGSWVKIETEKGESEARIIVEDNGIGIPEKDLPYIFERFYRVDKARSRQEGGTGLGLSICKWIAEGHGGYIDVKSTEGKGSRFTVHLPYDYKKQKTSYSLF